MKSLWGCIYLGLFISVNVSDIWIGLIIKGLKSIKLKNPFPFDVWCIKLSLKVILLTLLFPMDPIVRPIPLAVILSNNMSFESS